MQKLISLLLMLFLLCSTTFAKNLSSTDWAAVENLKVGSKVVVLTKNLLKYKGKITNVTTDSLTVSIELVNNSTRAMKIDKIDVKEVRKQTMSTALKYLLGAAIGAGIGASVGYGIGQATSQKASPGDRAFASDLLALGGIAVGTGLGIAGGALAAANKEGKLIYQAP